MARVNWLRDPILEWKIKNTFSMSYRFIKGVDVRKIDIESSKENQARTEGDVIIEDEVLDHARNMEQGNAYTPLVLVPVKNSRYQYIIIDGNQRYHGIQYYDPDSNATIDAYVITTKDKAKVACLTRLLNSTEIRKLPTKDSTAIQIIQTVNDFPETTVDELCLKTHMKRDYVMRHKRAQEVTIELAKRRIDISGHSIATKNDIGKIRNLNAMCQAGALVVAYGLSSLHAKELVDEVNSKRTENAQMATLEEADARYNDQIRVTRKPGKDIGKVKIAAPAYINLNQKMHSAFVFLTKYGTRGKLGIKTKDGLAKVRKEWSQLRKCMDNLLK